MTKYDVIVIGGGSAGLTCAIGAAKLGKKTLIIEKRKLGGECTWSGCIPSKAFIASGSLDEARRVSETVYSHENPEAMKSYGIDTLQAEAQFTDAHTVIAGGQPYSAAVFIIATGSTAAVPPIKGLEQIPFLTTENFFKLDSPPKSIAFIGGGVISLELAFPLARAGAKVTILEKAEVLLPNEDPAVRDIFTASLERCGIACATGADITEIHPEGGEALIRYVKGGQSLSLKTEKVLISAGRKAQTEGFGLEKIGVEHTPRGIKVNAFLQTSLPHIYAAGDCLDGYRFSHIAGRHGEIITRNLAFPWIKAPYKSPGTLFIMFGDPEYARCGMTETEARIAYGDIKVYEARAETTERAVSSFDKDFLLRVFCRKGRIVGAWCTSQRAGEIISPIQFLMGAGLPLKKYAEALQPYPGYGEVIRRLAKTAMIDDLLRHPLVKLFRR